MEARVFHIESPETFEEAIKAAAALLRAGQIVAVPTETVYGLAANALDGDAVRAIYRAKGRPAENPVIVHVASRTMARSCVAEWPEHAAALARAFWPGPLTLVLPKADCIPGIVTAGGPTVGVRWPAHPFTQALIRACDFPLAAPSANPANRISPTTAAHVFADMGGRVPLIVDAGPSSVGIESTVLDLSAASPRILRPGMVSREQIESALGAPLASSGGPETLLKSPGMLARHYSPRAPLVVMDWSSEAELLETMRVRGVPLEKVHLLVHERIPECGGFARISVIPQDAEAYARALYEELHRCDAEGAGLIVVEVLPRGAAWDGLRDRLKRASAGASDQGFFA
jgi:L-threonylcarbamoyladenylate synthase